MKKVECSLLQREPAVISLCRGDDGGEDTLKKEQKQSEREMRRNERKHVNRGSRSREEAAGETNKGDE